MRITVTSESTESSYRQRITAGGHALFADLDPEHQGRQTAPEPYELLLAAWGSCTNMTLQLYAARKQWPLEQVTTELQKVTQDDGQIILQKTIRVSGAFTPEQLQRLKMIAEKCPVNQLITRQGQPPRIESSLEWLGAK